MRSGRGICGGGAEHVWVKQALVEFAVGKKKDGFLSSCLEMTKYFIYK